jgi:hypothetical protein
MAIAKSLSKSDVAQNPLNPPLNGGLESGRGCLWPKIKETAFCYLKGERGFADCDIILAFDMTRILLNTNQYESRILNHPLLADLFLLHIRIESPLL